MRLSPLVLALTLVGCGGRPSHSLELPADYSGARSFIARVPALAYLYRDAAVVLVGRSLSDADAKVGLANLGYWVDIDPAYCELEFLSQAGIDRDQPFGWALFIGPETTQILFATLSDRSRFEAAAARLAQEHGTVLEPMEAGDGLVYLPRDDPQRAVVVRDQQLFIITTSGARSLRDLTAVRIASVGRQDSLAEDPDFLRAANDLEFGRDFSGYVATDRLIASRLEPTDTDRKLAELAGRLEEALAEARRQGAEDQVATLSQQTEWIAKLQRIETGRRRLLTGLAGDFGPFGFGIETSTGAIKLALVANPTGLPRRLLDPRPVKRLQLPLLIDKSPLFLLALRPGQGALRELVELWLAARGFAPATAATAFAEQTGEELDAVLGAVFRDEVGLVVSGQPFTTTPELTLLAHLADTRRAQEILTRLADHPAFTRTGDRLAVELGAQSLTLGIVEEILAATSDRSLFDRLTGKGPSFASIPSSLGQLLAQPAAANMVISGVVVAGLFEAEELSPGPRSWLELGADAPKSPEYTRTLEELALLEREFASGLVKLNGMARRQTLVLGESLGTTALAALETNERVVIFGGQFVATNTVLEAVSNWVEERRRFTIDRQQAIAALHQLEQQRAALESHLAELQLAEFEQRQNDSAHPDER